MSLDIMTRRRISKNLIIGIMNGLFTNRNHLQKKLEITAEIERVKYLGKVYAAVNLKNAMIKLFPKFTRNHSAEIVIQRPWRHGSGVNYGFKFSFNL